MIMCIVCMLFQHKTCINCLFNKSQKGERKFRIDMYDAVNDDS